MSPFLDTAPTKHMSAFRDACSAALWCDAAWRETERALTVGEGEGCGGEDCLWWWVGGDGVVVDLVGYLVGFFVVWGDGLGVAR